MRQPVPIFRTRVFVVGVFDGSAVGNTCMDQYDERDGEA